MYKIALFIRLTFVKSTLKKVQDLDIRRLDFDTNQPCMGR